MSTTTPRTDYDSPWKEALEEYLADALALLFPHIHAEIDWARGHLFLDKELQQVVREGDLGRRMADKLIQVWRHGGQDLWVLLHIEVQSQEESEFAQRMFIYFYRLFDRFTHQVVSLAILGDQRAGWRPTAYMMDLWGCALRFSYPIVKLDDYRARRAELEASLNPFATVVLTHLAAQDTHANAPGRQQVKLALTRRLYQSGYSRERVLSLYRFIDWLLELPDALEQAFWQDVQEIEEERAMPYLTTVERRGLEQGREQGREQGKRDALRRIAVARFGSLPPALEERIVHANSAALDLLLDRVAVAHSLADLGAAS